MKMLLIMLEKMLPFQTKRKRVVSCAYSISSEAAHFPENAY